MLVNAFWHLFGGFLMLVHAFWHQNASSACFLTSKSHAEPEADVQKESNQDSLRASAAWGSTDAMHKKLAQSPILPLSSSEIKEKRGHSYNWSCPWAMCLCKTIEQTLVRKVSKCHRGRKLQIKCCWTAVPVKAPMKSVPIKACLCFFHGIRCDRCWGVVGIWELLKKKKTKSGHHCLCVSRSRNTRKMSISAMASASSWYQLVRVLRQLTTVSRT
jgi:hypothetical protein